MTTIVTNKPIHLQFEVGQIVASKEVKQGCITIGPIEKIQVWPNGVVKYFLDGKDLDDFVIGTLSNLADLKNYNSGC